MTIFTMSPLRPADSQLSGVSLAGISTITSATPLNVMKHAQTILKNQAAFDHWENIHQQIMPDSTLLLQAETALSKLTSYSVQQVSDAQHVIQRLNDAFGNFFVGNIGGCLGETSVLALLIGACYLLYKKHITLKIPMAYLGTVALLSYIFGGAEGLFSGPWLFHLLTGGLILGAFFMATDMVTSPVTRW
jgi:electron transport complex protein RnfD